LTIQRLRVFFAAPPSQKSFNMNRLLICILWVLFGLALARPALLVPIYIYPDPQGLKDYERLRQVKLKSPGLEVFAVVNVDFLGCDWLGNREGYRDTMTRIIKGYMGVGIRVLGYISTRYSARSFDQDLPFSGCSENGQYRTSIKTNTQQWLKAFPGLYGIFLDELCYQARIDEKPSQANPDVCGVSFLQSQAPIEAKGSNTQPLRSRNVLGYMRIVYNYLRIQKKLSWVMANPGIAPDPVFLDGTAADTVIVFERRLAEFSLKEVARQRGQGPKNRLGVLVFDAPRVPEQAVLAELSEQAGFVFFTSDYQTKNYNDTLPGIEMPWDVMPSYLEELARRLEQIK
jgi:hypothetical protein